MSVVMTCWLATILNIVGGHRDMHRWLVGRRCRYLRLGLGFLLGMLLVCGVAMPTQAVDPWSTVTVAQAGASPTTLQAQAQQAYDLGQYDQARTLWESAREGFAQQGDRPNQVAVLNALSATYQQLGAWTEAEAAISTSWELLDALDGTTAQAIALRAQTFNSQGGLQLALGQPETARQSWQQAETLYRQLGDDQGILGSQLNQVQALMASGLYRQAYLTLDDLKAEIDALPPSSLKVLGLQAIGAVFQVAEDLPMAQASLEAAIALAEQIGETRSLSNTWLSLGNAYRATNSLEAAIDAYLTAGQYANSPVQTVIARLNAVSLLIRTQQWPKVETLLAIVEPLLTTLEPSRLEVYAQVNLAANLQQIREQEPAVLRQLGAALTQHITPQNIAQHLARALNQGSAIGDARAEAYATGQLGSLYEQTRQFDHALDLTERALILTQNAHATDMTYRWQWQKGRILKAQAEVAPTLAQQQSLRTGAIAAYTDAYKSVKRIRANLRSLDATVQFSFRDNVEPIYRGLVDLLTPPESGGGQPQSADLAEQTDSLELTRQVIEDLQLAELQNFFRSACFDIQAEKIDEVDPHAAILYPILLPDRLLVVHSLAGQALGHWSVPVSEATLQQTANQLFAAFNPVFSNRDRLEAATQLYTWLIAPIADQLHNSGIETLVFVLDGPLRNIPMAALYTGDHYLIEDFAVAVSPGLQLLAPKPLSENRLDVLVGALSEARQGFSALPGVSQEVEFITNLLPSQVLLNESFTYQNLEAGIERSDSPILHLATHGQFSSNLDETFLISWDEPLRIRDFQILVRDYLPQVTQPIELLVLSACQTAEGDDRAAMGLAGLAIRSGARSTLASLWAVNDQSTAALISSFYDHLTKTDGISKSEALRQAQLDLLHTSHYQHPFHWAPFVLVGNWL
jgi:CHAT domain-containing protein